MLSTEFILLGVSLLVLLSVVASRVSDRFGVPALVFFLVIGMLAGSEGPGGIYFNDPWLAKSVGIVALVLIIFSGGIETRWKETRAVLYPGLVLSTIGVLITTVILGVALIYIYQFSLMEGLLLGAIVSSTDVAAVFSVLRSRRVSLKGRMRPLLELESGSNDPMAVFLTLAFLRILMSPGTPLLSLLPAFFLEMGIGALMGYAMAGTSVFIINRIRLEYTGLYSVLTMSLILLTYAATTVLHGNGFLAVYLAGLIMANRDFLHKNTIVHFHEGMAWLMQIVMFLTLGLMVFPSQIIPILGSGMLVAVILMLVARPVSVFLCLLPFKMNAREKTMISWVGLRGAVPIILATFPLLAGLPHARLIFNVVFFVVVTSVLIQGASIPFVSKWLKVAVPMGARRRYPIEFERTEGMDADLTDLIVPYSSYVVGKALYEVKMPPKCLIVLISRGDKFIIPDGTTVIEGGDVFLVLAQEKDFAVLQRQLAKGI